MDLGKHAIVCKREITFSYSKKTKRKTAFRFEK